MLQFMRVKAEAEDGLLEKFAANVDYGSQEMVIGQANSLNNWMHANCAGIAWVELRKHVQYRDVKGVGFAPDDVEWELSLLFNDVDDAGRFKLAFNVVEKFSNG